ncbi:AMP-binding protein [Streptomyces antibioticus]|uniref:AMP-binding protein n=1 Tax=Streptomyces antibioticus TaxID=1890 RepID=UPI0036FD7E93
MTRPAPTAVEAPAQPPTYPDLVPAALRAEWRARGLYPDVPVFDLFRGQAAAQPDTVAVFDDSGETTYAELLDASLRLAAGLRGLGIRAGQTVACQLPNSWHAVAVDLAVAALGAIVLPFPAGRGDQDIRALLTRSRAVALIVPARHQDVDMVSVAAALAPGLPAFTHLIAHGGEAGDGRIAARLEDLLAHEPLPVAELPQVSADAVVRLLVSSGTESDPKLVAYSHNALVGGRGRFLGRLQVDGRPMRAMYLMPLGSSFGSGAVFCVLAHLGGSLVLRRRFDPGEALSALHRCRPTHLLGVPTMFQHMVAHAALAASDTSSVECVVTGGALIDAATARRCTEHLGRRLISLYGSADGVNCHTGVDDSLEVSRETLGRPDPDVCAIRILDDKDRELPPGEPGEIVALGPMTPLCYVDAPELNERYRMPGGWVRTGDRGWIGADGRLRMAGRKKDVIIRGGGNISPAQLEGLISGHPDVLGVACVAVADRVMGQRVCACLVPAGGRAPTLGEVTGFLRAGGLEPHKLPEYLLILDELPLGAAGKVDKRRLAALAERHFAHLGGPGRPHGVIPGCERDLREKAAPRHRPATELVALVRDFVEQEIIPAEPVLQGDGPEARRRLLELRARAREAGLWGLGFPESVGGPRLPLADYLLIAEQEGRSEYGPSVLGGETVVDVRMLLAHGGPRLLDAYLQPLVDGELSVSFGMTEPGRPGSQPQAVSTHAAREGDGWSVIGRKWCISNAGFADCTVTMARTESGLSALLIPTSTPGYRKVRSLKVYGRDTGQWEIELDHVHVPGHLLLGREGDGLAVAGERMTLGRTLRSMHWLGAAQRAFDLMCRRLREREVHGGLLSERQLMREHVFLSYSAISAARELTLRAAGVLDRGLDGRVEVAAAKVAASRTASDVADRAVQVFGAEGLSDDQPLSAMARRLRTTRILDGPDEVHITSAAGRLLQTFATATTFDFTRSGTDRDHALEATAP